MSKKRYNYNATEPENSVEDTIDTDTEVVMESPITADDSSIVEEVSDNDVTAAIKKEEESMTEVLRRIMKPEIDAALYRAEKRGKDIGLQEGEVIGLRKGVAQSVREFIVRMLKKGTFSPDFSRKK